MLDFSDSTISPMNFHFSASTCRDTLRLIFEKLPIPDLARSSCVCRVWNSVASDHEIVTRAFKDSWNLKHIFGKPASGNFWRDNSLGKFAISHRIVRGDSIASLAAKYSVQATCYVEVDTCAKREVAVLYLEGGPELHKTTSNGSSSTSSCSATDLQSKKRVIESLRRSMQVDDATARYYLTIADGDPRAAISQFSQDLRWETHLGFA